jgi:hypothetical protein
MIFLWMRISSFITFEPRNSRKIDCAHKVMLMSDKTKTTCAKFACSNCGLAAGEGVWLRARVVATVSHQSPKPIKEK